MNAEALYYKGIGLRIPYKREMKEPMHLAFIDFVYGYDAARPEVDAPLGGTTSAICFLARELVKTGVACTFFNRVGVACSAHGVASLPLTALADDLGRGIYDAYIFCGRWTEEWVNMVRSHTDKPLIGWMHESMFAAPMTPAVDAFDGVVFVSEWQQRVNQSAIKPHWQQTIIRNAMNPAIANSFAADGNILATKAKPPIFLFAGSFARGAFHIPPLLDKIRAKRSDFSVEMFCNLDPSRDAAKDAEYIGWLRGLPNIVHVGMVGQLELARRMKHASVLLAPNMWPETSCIALIEALASGLTAITTNRAALPETSAGFARQIPVENPDDPVRFDGAIDYDAFTDAILEVWRESEEKTEKNEIKLRRQVDYFQANYQWQQRVSAWMDFIKALMH